MKWCCLYVYDYNSNNPAAVLHVNLQGASVDSTAVLSPDESCTGITFNHMKDRLTGDIFLVLAFGKFVLAD